MRAHSLEEAYEKGYADGLRMMEKMHWRRTHLGDLLRRFPHRTEQRYRAAYEEGFFQAMALSATGERMFAEEKRKQ